MVLAKRSQSVEVYEIWPEEDMLVDFVHARDHLHFETALGPARGTRVE